MNAYQSLDERYFEWLYNHVLPLGTRNPARSHFLLFEQLFKTPFIWSVPNDDNRVEDSKDLREDFLRECQPDEDDLEDWMNVPVTLLEVVLVMARHASFESDGQPDEWVHEILTNLDLWKYTDEVYTSDEPYKPVEQVMQAVNDRTYGPDGHGGMFPLKYSDRDQREVELWYQLSAYLLEQMD